ncbi:TPA: hypothetical protein DIU22_04940 [Candidatus Woesebacteria bacterium]|nr:hypothetical protein [Candidatus Woesebacteria bacterium]HCY17956.1 hypothetical protein [Candidatus Nomurabacteria bacterium]
MHSPKAFIDFLLVILRFFSITVRFERNSNKTSFFYEGLKRNPHFVVFFLTLVYNTRTNTTASVRKDRGGFCYRKENMLALNIMSRKEKVAVYIDGGNTYRRLKELGIPQKFARFDYSSFVEHLVGDRELISKRQYIGIVKNIDNSEKAEKMVRDQQKFLDGLKVEGFDIKYGKIMYDGGNIREKGVDIKLAVDLVIGATDNLYDTAIVISSDTDLIPAIKYVCKAKKKSLEYIGFGSSPSLGMIKESSIPRVFSNIDMVKFQRFYYRGVVIEESLENKDVLKDIKILKTKTEPVKEKHKTSWVKQWTMHTIEIKEENADKVAEQLNQNLDKKHSWYADFKNKYYHFIIYQGKIFKVDLKNPTLYKDAKEYGIALGIPEYQVDFAPDDKVWER